MMLFKHADGGYRIIISETHKVVWLDKLGGEIEGWRRVKGLMGRPLGGGMYGHDGDYQGLVDQLERKVAAILWVDTRRRWEHAIGRQVDGDALLALVALLAPIGRTANHDRKVVAALWADARCRWEKAVGQAVDGDAVADLAALLDPVGRGANEREANHNGQAGGAGGEGW